MSRLEAWLSAGFARRVPAIRLLAFAVLAALAWPLPPMIAFSNPAEAAYFGRYDRLYFGLLVGYAVLILGWTTITVWLALRLDGDRMEQWRHWARQHAGPIITLMAAAALLGWIVLALVDWQVRAIPGDVRPRLRLVLPFILAMLALAIVAGWGDVLRTGIRESRVFGIASLTASSHLAGAALMILAGWLLLQRGLMTTALIKDASAHLYIGQHLLRGGVPYRTVIYFHPPLRFLVSALWALPGAAGLPPIESARVLYGLMALGVVSTVYGIGKQLSGSIGGGVVAAGLMLHTPFVTTTVFEGPNLKIAVALALTLSVWLAQRERWFWAGVAGAAGIGLWLPAIGGAIAIGLTAILMRQERWRATRDTLLGGLAIGGLIVGWMAVAGTLDRFFRQSILAGLNVAGNDGGGRLAALRNAFGNLPNLLHGRALAVAAGIGLVLILVGRGRNERERAAWLAPVLTGGMLLLVMSQDVLGDLDFITLGGLLVGFAAVAVLFIVDLTPAPVAGHWIAAGLVILSVVAMGIVTTVSGKFDREPRSLTLADQHRMATALESALSPDDSVQSFDLMWFMVLTGRDNPLPVLQARPKGQVANEEASWPEQTILEALEETQPAVVMLEAGSQVHMDELGDQYLYAGSFDVSTVRAQRVYIRRDREGLQAAFEGWPEANQ